MILYIGIMTLTDPYKHIREWVDLLAEEPENELIYIREVVSSLRRMID